MSNGDYWKIKYLKYKKKVDILKQYSENQNTNINLYQSGGKNNDENDNKHDDTINDKKKYLKTLLKIKEGLKTKGYVFWFDSAGKILAQGLDTKSAKSKIIKLISKDKNSWENLIITEVVIEFDPKNIMDETSGGLSISIDLNKVIVENDKLSIQMKNKNNSLFSMCYKYDELQSFKLSDLKKLSMFVSNETLKHFKSDIYQYKDVLKYL